MDNATIKAIKAGTAYKKWFKRQVFAQLLIWAYIFIGFIIINLLFLKHGKDIFGIGLIIIYFFVLRISNIEWECPFCGNKLPCKKITIKGFPTVEPILLENCPFCQKDLKK